MQNESSNGREVAVRQPVIPEPVPLKPMMNDAEIASAFRIAKALHISGIYKDIAKAEQAFAKILIGRDLGLSPTQSMQGLHFVEGNVQVHYRTLGMFVKRNGYDFKIVELANEAVTIEFYGPMDAVTGEREHLGSSRFTQEDAHLAELDKPKGKYQTPSNFTKYPRNMLIARAMSNGVGWFCPEVAAGIPVYVPGEIEQKPQAAASPGPGDAQPVELGPEVEAVMALAVEKGHAGLSDRETIAMTLADQPAEFVQSWVENATRELEAMTPVADAEVVSDAAAAAEMEAIGQMRGQARRLMESAERARQQGDVDEAAMRHGTAGGLLDSADVAEANAIVAGSDA